MKQDSSNGEFELDHDLNSKGLEAMIGRIELVLRVYKHKWALFPNRLKEKFVHKEQIK